MQARTDRRTDKQTQSFGWMRSGTGRDETQTTDGQMAGRGGERGRMYHARCCCARARRHDTRPSCSLPIFVSFHGFRLSGRFGACLLACTTDALLASLPNITNTSTTYASASSLPSYMSVHLACFHIFPLSDLFFPSTCTVITTSLLFSLHHLLSTRVFPYLPTHLSTSFHHLSGTRKPKAARRGEQLGWAGLGWTGLAKKQLSRRVTCFSLFSFPSGSRFVFLSVQCLVSFSASSSSSSSSSSSPSLDSI
ncbi:uncharacterized protein IWZ02DRAFT_308916 [Phyllosticta citriasiana]|uniref:uncharacterized protein n=1 Tax=Phyllosticta citriasiana TaxID=595635 RepID=UPI0030FD9CAD